MITPPLLTISLWGRIITTSERGSICTVEFSFYLVKFCGFGVVVGKKRELLRVVNDTRMGSRYLKTEGHQPIRPMIFNCWMALTTAFAVCELPKP